MVATGLPVSHILLILWLNPTIPLISNVPLSTKKTCSGVLAVFSIMFFDKLKIDDPVGAIYLHGTCGLLGLLLAPVTNSGASFSDQLIAAVIIFGWFFSTNFIVWFVLKMIVGIRVSAEKEYEGVDIDECDLEAYPEFTGK